jgi:hypothetical protein
MFSEIEVELYMAELELSEVGMKISRVALGLIRVIEGGLSSIGVIVSVTDGVISRNVLVALSTAVRVADEMKSVAVIGILLDTFGVMIAEELIIELDDALHLPLTSISASLGTVPFWAGSVNVHSFSSFMFLTPSRDRRRYALA